MVVSSEDTQTAMRVSGGDPAAAVRQIASPIGRRGFGGASGTSGRLL